MELVMATHAGIEFVRVFSQKRYGIPPEQVAAAAERRDDKAGKLMGIQQHIGRRPVKSPTIGRRASAASTVGSTRRRRGYGSWSA